MPSEEVNLITSGTGLVILMVLSLKIRLQEDEMRPVGGIPIIVVGLGVILAAGVVGLTTVPPQVSTELQVVAFAISLQALLLIVDVRPPGLSRNTWLLPGMGHGAMLAGSVLVLDRGPFEPAVALVIYATGVSLLILHAFWLRELADEVPSNTDSMTAWEPILLLFLFCALLSVVVASLAVPPGEVLPPPNIGQPAAIVAGSMYVLSLAILSGPPQPPELVPSFTGIIAAVFEHGATVILLLNVLLFAIILLSSRAFYVIIGIFLFWLTVAAAIEYAQVIYAHRRKQRNRASPPPLEADAPVTVIVIAAFEASVLLESLETNLEALGQRVQFIIVPAARSDDGTVEIAREFADEHNHVRVIEGTSGSKAGDLNQVWPHVDTGYAFILDADETITPETISRGLRTLRERPKVGVIQGRKAAMNPDTNAFSRFVSVERQHSTWVDHPFVDDVLGAGHFGGSITIFRREVPLDAGGWDPDALTEDIDFTLRMLSETEWGVEYDPEMVGRESHPATVQALVRQRERWARGWVQAAFRHFGDILRSRQKLGLRRTFGIEWLLFTSVGATLSTLFPVIMILWFMGFAPPLPTSVAVILAGFLLPVRAISFGYAAFRDPKIPIPTTPRRVVEVLGYAYLWILFGWFIQLHALYLKFSGAPRLWYVTEKSGTSTGT